MSDTRQSLVVREEVDLGRRLELARVAARKEQEDMARVAGISVRSYQRTIAGTRKPRLGELLAWAKLTDQDLRLFGGDSSDEGVAILSDLDEGVKRSVA